MIRGTTQTIALNLPIEIKFDTLYITFAQNSTTILEKTLTDVLIDGKAIVVPLTQAETLLFSANGYNVRLQLRGKVGNTAYASQIMSVPVSDILKGGEI